MSSFDRPSDRPLSSATPRSIRDARFREALKEIPISTPFVHHGRDPQAGLDCIGLLIALYNRVGLPVDQLDLPYGSRDQLRQDRGELLAKQMAILMRELDVRVPLDCRNGDVLVIGPQRLNHLGMCIDGCLVEMMRKGLRATKLSRVWPEVTAVWRHKSLCD